MAGFEPRTSGIKSDRSTNCATAHKSVLKLLAYENDRTLSLGAVVVVKCTPSNPMFGVRILFLFLKNC